MMILEELYCFVDDFCKIFVPEWQKYLLSSGKQKRNRDGKLSISEIMTIYLLFQSSGYRDFKHYYLLSVQGGALKKAFPDAVSYPRFITLIPRILIPLCIFLQLNLADFDGLGFVDSTPIAVCHNKRIYSHRVFNGSAKRGKSTKGWFFGFKLHVICNSQSELCAVQITPGNCSDLMPMEKMTMGITGKLFGDKGYISKELFESLFERGLQLITGIRKNMKNKLVPIIDKILLRKRGLIESINNQFKNVFHLEHSRHRSPFNGFANMLSAITAYIFHPNKPTLQFSDEDRKVLMAA